MESTIEQSQDEAVRIDRTLPQYAGLAARGFAMGSADVVPGVSGGTMAFIMGIYEELIMSIRMVGQPKFWDAVIHFRIGEALRLLNWKFLAAVFFGIFAAILTLAPLIEYVLVNHPVMIWSFFFGLVVASVFAVSGRVSRWTPLVVGALAAGAAFAFWIVGLVPVQTPETWWFLILSGALASSAMILPGISGSFILLLLGKYEFVISAVNTRDIPSLILIAIGAAIGLVTLAQILSWLFKHYHDVTVAILIGFMAGSLRKIWPWKEVVETAIDRHGEEVPIVLTNVLPPMSVNGAFNTEILAALAIAAVGFGVVLLLERIGSRTR
jgi:putative membrane protein